MGRFMSPDPSGLLFADTSNPQGLNLYSYVLNNPLRYIDPTGMYCDYSDHNDPNSGFQDNQYDFSSNSGECGHNGGQWVNDGYTHNGSDDVGRPNEAVSSNTQTSGDWLDNNGLSIQAMFAPVRFSLQFDQPVSVGGSYRPLDPKARTFVSAARPKIKLSDAQISNLCAIAVSLQAGGTVPGGNTYGTASYTPSEDTPANHLPVPSGDGVYPGSLYGTARLTNIQVDSASAQASNYAALASLVGNYAACKAAVTAAN